MEQNILDRVNEAADIKKLDNKELRLLADEIRNEIITTVSKNGGHLASNLGVVEITIALHRVFETPKDKIIFDVGHQCYTHKILTSRKEQFHTIRKENGISGFPKREESDHDAFNTGHSSTSISAALGMARARDLSGDDYNIVALIGDGAFTGGMVWEALNDTGHSKKKIIVILNENEMSIGKNIGALSTYLSNLRSARGYIHLKGFISKAIKSIPLVGRPIKNFIEKVKNIIKFTFMPNIIFEQLGFKYYGIVDGHDIADIEKILNRAKQIDEPVIIHVKTQKGKGVAYASDNPELYHSTCPFNACTGEKVKENYKIPQTISKHLIELSQKDDKICTVTAAMEQGCGLSEYKNKFPDRFFDVGIAEQHAVTMCAGMATIGFKPVFCVYSTFLQRAYDQILHDMCMQNLGVTIVVFNSGVVGDDGETHHGIFDISFLRHIPNLNLYAPSSIQESEFLIDEAIKSRKPSIILLPKSMPTLSSIKLKNSTVWNKLTNAKKHSVAIITNGGMIVNSIDAIKNNDMYKFVDVYNASIIKPIDTVTIEKIARDYNKIITIEDNVLQGGFGSAVLEELGKYNFNTSKILRLGFDDCYISQGEVSSLHKTVNIDADSIAKKLKELIENE